MVGLEEFVDGAECVDVTEYPVQTAQRLGRVVRQIESRRIAAGPSLEAL
jgi:hypothetical protein